MCVYVRARVCVYICVCMCHLQGLVEAYDLTRELVLPARVDGFERFELGTCQDDRVLSEPARSMVTVL